MIDSRSGYRISCDVGGTFTDVAVSRGSEAPSVFKSPTRVTNPEAGVIDALELAADSLGLDEIQGLLSQADCFIHATTLGLNAILEGHTAPIALITTAGHRDTLLLREGGKADVFNLRLRYPAPYVSRSDTFEADERINAAGEIIKDLDTDALRVALGNIRVGGYEAIAVCLLWSIVNPEHERSVGRMIERLLPAIPYALSHQVAPVIREYRRAAATCIDASLLHLMGGYLDRLRTQLGALGFGGRLYAVTSGGGLLDFDQAARSPVQTVNSGRSVAPAGARSYATQAGVEARDILVVDTGGTSFDISAVRNDEIPLTSELWLGPRFTGHLLGLPAVDVLSIGAGGGSVAWTDHGGLLHVGPQSAGADPGPAAYGQGGQEPTVTDAAVVCGWIDAERFLGGRLRLDVAAARQAVEDRIATPCRYQVEEAAAAVIGLADEQMISAMEELTISQGIDPREASLVAGGGASGLSIDRIARRLGCRDVIIPPTVAGLSACGGLFSAEATDLRDNFFTPTSDFDFDGVATVIEALHARARDFFCQTDGGVADQELSWFVSARYAFQVWEIEVPLGVETARGLASRRSELRADSLAALRSAFHEQHRKLFAVAEPDQDIECVAWRLRASMRPREEPGMQSFDTAATRESIHTIYVDDRWIDAAAWDYAAITTEPPVVGPAIVHAPSTTVLVRPGSTIKTVNGGSLRLVPPSACPTSQPDLPAGGLATGAELS